MSYRCQQCKRTVAPGLKANKVVVEKRPKRYTHPNGPDSLGWEIVKEIVVCPECYQGVAHV